MLKVALRKIRNKIEKLGNEKEEENKERTSIAEQDLFELWLQYIAVNSARRLLKDSCTEQFKAALG